MHKNVLSAPYDKIAMTMAPAKVPQSMKHKYTRNWYNLALSTLIACTVTGSVSHDAAAQGSSSHTPLGVDLSGNPVYSLPSGGRGGIPSSLIVGTTNRGGTLILNIPGATTPLRAPIGSAPPEPCLAYHPFPPASILWYQATSASNDSLLSGASGVDQGKIDNCWFESAVAAVARTAPGARLISDMITSPNSVNYTVIFPDTPDTKYTVTQAATRKTPISKDSALWARVLELAFFERYPILKNTTPSYTLPNGKLVDGNGALANGFQTQFGMLNLQIGLQAMTGHQASAVLFRPQSSALTVELELKTVSTENLHDLLIYNGNNRIVMTAGTPANAPSVIVPEHVYTVISCSADNKIILRNPWGNNNPTPKHPNLTKPGETKGGVTDLGQGLIQMDLSTFHNYYRVLAYSRVFHT